MGCAFEYVLSALSLGPCRNLDLLASLKSLILPSVDNGDLCRLPSVLLLRQDIHPSFLPPSLPAASEAAIHHLRAHGLLHHLLLGRLLDRHRPLQRPEPSMGYHSDDELFRLRQACFCDWRSRSRCRCHHTRISNTNGGKATNIMAPEDLLAIRLLSWIGVSAE